MTAPTSDIQHVLSKTQAVEQLYQAHKQQPDNDQQKFAATVQQKMYDKAHQTQESPEAEQGKISQDRRDKLSLSFKKREQKKEKNKKEEPHEGEDTFDETVGHIVDIKV
ncbi:hypothetical protein JW960_01965 [candidate division KSB1 bacterium]|nr:hypothetical protein [candidate division KSB1 bacterium]